MSLTKKYEEILGAVKNNDLTSEAKSIVEKKDYSLDNWLKGIAILELITETSSDFEDLFLNLFKKGRDRILGVYLNDEDYKFYFDKGVETCIKLTQLGFHRAWETLALRYVLARKEYNNPKLELELYEKGIAKGDTDCMAAFAYSVLSKKEHEERKEEGEKYLQAAKDAGLEKAFEMSFAIDLRSDMLGETLIKNLEAYIETVKDETKKPWDLLGEVYLIKENNEEKAIEYFMMDDDCVISKYHMGFLILNGYTDKYPVEKGVEYLSSLAYYPEIAYRLGLYNYRIKDVEKAKELYEISLKYSDHAPSMFELSMISIYDDKDKEKGMAFLEKSIELDYSPALFEKSFLIEDNNEEAQKLLERAVELGNMYAPYHLGLGYQNGRFGEPDLRKAFECFEIGMERNSIQSMEMLGYYYMGRFEEVTDLAKGLEIYQKASEMGSNWATVELGRCYQDGIGTEKNFAKTVELYTKASENNYPYAFVMLGEFYSYYNTEPDYSKAFSYFNEAAKAEVVDGYYNLGRMYKYAMGIEANPVLAVEYFQKAMDGNSIDGKIEVALAYENGSGVEQDKDKAFELMKEMAEQNIPYAQYKLGTYYYYGFIKEDEVKGMEWFNTAYNNGNPLAALAIGEHYLYSAEKDIDSNDAFQYFEFAAQRNQISEGIGICYMYGLGVDTNEEEAFKYFKIASERGYTAATYRLGLCYRDGLGTDKNEEKGHALLLDAAERNNIYSIYAVGMNFLKGRGVQEDAKKGAEYLLKAAEREYSYAQYELANCFLSGNGVPEDEEKAMYWYKKAADNGHKEAKEIIG